MSGRARPSGRGLPPDPVAARSPAVWRFMGVYFARYARRHLNAVRIAGWGAAPALPASGPVVIYCNHPAWWDAAIIILLAQRFYPEAESYAPFDAAMLARYRIFSRMGAFGVDLDSPRGAAAFMAASRKILERPGRVMWITAQGRFSDVRERPLGLRPGVARLPELAPTPWWCRSPSTTPSGRSAGRKPAPPSGRRCQPATSSPCPARSASPAWRPT